MKNKSPKPPRKPILRDGMIVPITDPAELDLVYDRLVSHVFAREPYPVAANFHDTVDALARELPAVREVDLDRLIDRRFVDDAVRRGLTRY